MSILHPLQVRTLLSTGKILLGLTHIMSGYYMYSVVKCWHDLIRHNITLYITIRRNFQHCIYMSKNYSNMDAGMHHAKNRGNKEIPLAILSRILAQSYVTICLNYVGRVTHGCSIYDSIAKGISLFPRFFTWCIPTSILIQLNDFCTCSTYCSWFTYKRSYAHVYMHRAAHLPRVSLVKCSSHTLGS